MSIKERLKKYIKTKNLTNQSFEKSIGTSNGYINNISKGIGGEYLERIRENYYDLNINWLLTGKGSMLRGIEIHQIGINTLSEKLLHFQMQNNLITQDLVGNLKLTPLQMKKLIDANEITEEHINAVCEKFGILNKWFLTGEGKVPILDNYMVSEPINTYKKEEDKIFLLQKENELLKENIISLKENIISLKETNELLKDKIESLNIEQKNKLK